MILSYFDLVLLFGSVLALLLSFYLWFYPSNLRANKVLGFLAFCWSMSVFSFLLRSPIFFAKYPHLYGIFGVFPLLFYPLVFIYIKTYLNIDNLKRFRFLIHFLPSALYLVFSSPFLLKGTDDKVFMIVNNVIPIWFHILIKAFNLVVLFQGIFYIVVSMRTLHNYQYFNVNRLSESQGTLLKWLRLFLVINAVLWCIAVMGIILNLLDITIGVNLFNLFYLGLFILTIVLCITAIRSPELFSEEECVRVKALIKEEDSKQAIVLSENDLLLNYIKNEKPYLKPDLKMQDLVDATGLSAKRISEIFNVRFNKSFYDIINEYRIEAVIELIKQDYHIKHNLPYLAELSGFNSKTTFNRIFKKHTTHTPSEYIKNLEK